jgi:SAM-dependent methyltransferase
MNTHKTPSLTDMYGYAYLAAEKGGTRPGVTWLIYQDSDGFGFAEDVVNYFAPAQWWWRTDIWACDQARGRVLDIGCGAGRHALRVAGAGHRVVGLEPSPDAVGVAARRSVDARKGGLPDLPDGLGSFDTFLLAGGGLHLLTVGSDKGTALQQLATAAEPGACILGTMAEPEQNAEQEMSYRIRVQHEGTLSRWSQWSDTAVALPATKLTELVDGTGWVVEEIRHRDETCPADIFSPEQLQALDDGTPWTPSQATSQVMTESSYLAELRLVTRRGRKHQ